MTNPTATPMCPAQARRAPIHGTGPDVTIGCYRPEGHERLHFDALHGDWADTDTGLRPYSAREHLMRLLALLNQGMRVLPEHEAVIDAFVRELATDIRSGKYCDGCSHDCTCNLIADLMTVAATPGGVLCLCGDTSGIPHGHPNWADPSPRIHPMPLRGADLIDPEAHQ